MSHSRTTSKLGALIVFAALAVAGCDSKTPAPAASAAPVSDANTKRWDKYQASNKKDMSNAQNAFEKRQAQLAEKRKKGDAGSASAAVPVSPATPASPSATPPK